MPLKLPSGTGVQMQSPSSIAKHMTMLLYGKAKSGKTTLAAPAAAVAETSPVAAVDFGAATGDEAGASDVDGSLSAHRGGDEPGRRGRLRGVDRGCGRTLRCRRVPLHQLDRVVGGPGRHDQPAQ